MRAALLAAVNQPLEIAPVKPLPLRYGQVFVRVLASGICGAQLQEIRGEKGAHFPRLMGHEGCGVVDTAGPGVSKLRAGDRVVMHWRKGSGMECEPPRYLLGQSDFTGGQVVTFATASVCSENRLTKVPADAPLELCTLLGCGLSTALGTIESDAMLRFGETILIIGCGGLGLNLILAARLAQASLIAAVDIHQNKMEAACAMGAHHYGRLEDFADNRFDAVIDTTGQPGVMAQGIDLLAPSGRFVMVGQPKPGASVEIRMARRLFDGEGKRIMATQGGRFQPDTDIPRYVAMHRAGLLNLTGLITHRLGLDDINEGIRLVAEGKAGRILVEM